MENPLHGFLPFLLAVGAHATTLAAGCIVTVMIGILEKHVLKRPISVKAEIAVLLAFVFFACFQAWRDQWIRKTPNVSPVEVTVEAPPSPPQKAYVSFENISFPQFVEGQPLLARFPFVNTTAVPAQRVVPLVHVYVVPFQPSKRVVDTYFKKHETSFGPASLAEGVTLLLSPAALSNPRFKDAEGPVVDRDLLASFRDGKKAVLLLGSLFFSDEAGRHRFDVCEWTVPPIPSGTSVSSSLAVYCNGHNGLAN
jgi:hypothetical protein